MTVWFEELWKPQVFWGNSRDRDAFHLTRARAGSVIVKRATPGISTVFLEAFLARERAIQRDFQRMIPPARGTVGWIRQGGKRPLRGRR